MAHASRGSSILPRHESRTACARAGGACALLWVPGGVAYAGSRWAPPLTHSCRAAHAMPLCHAAGLSWTTDDVKLRQYFENFGSVLEAFVR